MPTLENITVSSTVEEMIGAINALGDKAETPEQPQRLVPRYVRLYRELGRKSRLEAEVKAGRRDADCEHLENATETVHRIMDTAPSGSGIDCGTKLLGPASLAKSALIFRADFHHMDQNGMYDGWTEHHITVTADLSFGYRLKISGRNRNGIKEYLSDIFSYWLDEKVSEFD